MNDSAPQATTEINEEEQLITEEALSEAQQGRFQHTMLEMWYATLCNLVAQAKSPLNIEVATSILQTYPWLRHDDLVKYQKDRETRLIQARDVLLEVIGEDREKIFSENEDDWNLHAELYIEVLAGWNKLARIWDENWGLKPSKVSHATIADVIALLLNNDFGMVEGLRNLANFDLTPELREKLNEELGLPNE